MPIGGERAAVQNPFLRYAEEAGWAVLSREEALDLRRGITSPVLDAVMIEQIQRLNPGVVDALRAEQIRDRLVRVRPNIEGNLEAWEYLKGLKTVFVEAEKRERNVRLLDPVHIEANRFHITDEFTFSNGSPPDIRTDLMLFVNGVPVIVGETKSARQTEGIAQAFDDIRYYHEKGPELLALLQVHALTHLVQFYYGATWNLSRKGLFNWRDEAADASTGSGQSFESLVKTFVAPRRVLRVLTEFILFTRQDGELGKAVLRPHQMRAAERCVARARDGEKQRGLIWHTQGSGKTYTMITVAKRLMADPVFQNPTVLMLVDRNELEAQLFANLEAVGLGRIAVAESKKHLRRLLESRPMQQLTPDATMLVSEAGDAGREASYRAVLRAEDGRCAMVYSTRGLGFELDLSKMVGAAISAWWYSPRDGRLYDGQFEPPGKPFATLEPKGKHTFTPPTSGLNHDWVLVLDDATAGFVTPGTRR